MKMERITLPIQRRDAAHRETDASYRGVFTARGRYRVAICPDGIQWLFQQRVTNKPCAGARWRTLGYFATRKALIRLQHRSTGQHWPELMTLPERLCRESRT
jgi:hypothetical protein